MQSIQPGERVFSVSIQGRQVLMDFDVVEAAGRPNRAVVREFKSIAVGKQLLVSLTPSEASSIAKPIICGIEVIADSPKNDTASDGWHNGTENSSAGQFLGSAASRTYSRTAQLEGGASAIQPVIARCGPAMLQ